MITSSLNVYKEGIKCQDSPNLKQSGADLPILVCISFKNTPGSCHRPTETVQWPRDLYIETVLQMALLPPCKLHENQSGEPLTVQSDGLWQTQHSELHDFGVDSS